jgi:predicted dithiol-disulfide oxidoreductase (DUF899 family)
MKQTQLVRQFCGHDLEVVFENVEDEAARAKMFESVAEQVCADCQVLPIWREVLSNVELWTELTKGSEKQLAWANSLRSKKTMLEIEHFVSDCHVKLITWPGHNPRQPKVAGMIFRLLDTASKIRKINDAKWWIDHRGYGPNELLEFVSLEFR